MDMKVPARGARKDYAMDNMGNNHTLIYNIVNVQNACLVPVSPELFHAEAIGNMHDKGHT